MNTLYIWKYTVSQNDYKTIHIPLLFDLFRRRRRFLFIQDNRVSLPSVAMRHRREQRLDAENLPVHRAHRAHLAADGCHDGRGHCVWGAHGGARSPRAIEGHPSC